MHRSPLPLMCLIVFTFTGIAVAQPRGFNYDEAKVPKYTLPDPLKMEDGTAVTSVKQWPKRRAEILDLFKNHMFGAMPPAPKTFDVKKSDWTSFSIQDGEKDGDNAVVVRQQIVTMTFERNGHRAEVSMLLLTPDASANKPPYRTFLAYNFKGNHTIQPSKTIPLKPIWHRSRSSKPSQPTEKERGISASRWDVLNIVKRGYALATIHYGDVDPDYYDEFKNGIHAQYPAYQNRDDNWTSIGAWAWVLSRAVDHFESRSDIDHTRVAVLGHSRLGKTSLWAGATDPRFALVISNNSGCGGAALSRRAFGETVKRINTIFPHWFCKKFKTYNDNENTCPVDQHMLIALMAPRPVYIASAEGDRWADPRGEFLSGKHASDVYRLLGKEAIARDQNMPPVNKPIHTTVGYHIRTGKHDVTRYDWTQYLDFADKHLK